VVRLHRSRVACDTVLLRVDMSMPVQPIGFPSKSLVQRHEGPQLTPSPRPYVPAQLQFRTAIQTKPAGLHLAAPPRYLPPAPSGLAIQQQPGSQSVIQRERYCRECRRYVDYSDDHSRGCSRYYLRTFQTVADRNAPVLTRSHSFERLHRSGSAERVHQHENRHQANSDTHDIGQWDRDGNYTGRRF
jgi:hypothetical protein